MNDLLDGLQAAGLNPVVIDEDTDISEAIVRNRETNTEFLDRVMNYGCPTGGLIQPFVIEALFWYCKEVEESPPAVFGENTFINGDAWKTTGAWLHKELQEKYR